MIYAILVLLMSFSVAGLMLWVSRRSPKREITSEEILERWAKVQSAEDKATRLYDKAMALGLDTEDGQKKWRRAQGTWVGAITAFDQFLHDNKIKGYSHYGDRLIYGDKSA